MSNERTRNSSYPCLKPMCWVNMHSIGTIATTHTPLEIRKHINTPWIKGKQSQSRDSLAIAATVVARMNQHSQGFHRTLGDSAFALCMKSAPLQLAKPSGQSHQRLSRMSSLHPRYRIFRQQKRGNDEE